MGRGGSTAWEPPIGSISDKTVSRRHFGGDRCRYALNRSVQTSELGAQPNSATNSVVDALNALRLFAVADRFRFGRSYSAFFRLEFSAPLGYLYMKSVLYIILVCIGHSPQTVHSPRDDTTARVILRRFRQHRAEPRRWMRLTVAFGPVLSDGGPPLIGRRLMEGGVHPMAERAGPVRRSPSRARVRGAARSGSRSTGASRRFCRRNRP